MFRFKRCLTLATLGLSAGLFSNAASQSPTTPVPELGVAGPSRDYVGSQSCRACHSQIYERWSKTRMANVVADPRQHPDAIIPVPLHPQRLREREFNQALLLSREIRKTLKVRLDYTSLIRRRWTEPQTTLSAQQRAANVKDAFEVKSPGKVKGKRVLLVDDVFTSGATSGECARKLKQAGAARVDVFTLTRAV